MAERAVWGQGALRETDTSREENGERTRGRVCVRKRMTKRNDAVDVFSRRRQEKAGAEGGCMGVRSPTLSLFRVTFHLSS